MGTESGKQIDMAAKLVQEIAQKGEGVPERFILKEGQIPHAIDANPTLWEETLLIDFSLLSSDDSSSSTSAQQKELSKLHYALKHWGCFQIKNHGMASLFLDELLQVSKEFFGLPLEERLKCSIKDDFFNGYGNVAPSTAGNMPINWNDRLSLTVYPQDKIRLQLWPQKPPKFREILQEYSLNLKNILEVVLKAMAKSLDLKEDSFLSQHGKQGSMETRFGFYPRCPRPDQVFGVHPHSDRSTITILLPDKDVVEGLQVEKDDRWFKVPVIPGALFINLGDFGEVMSNGIFKSALHRVVTNAEKDRVSIVAFCIPDLQAEVGPIDELISPNQPKIYNSVDMKTFRQLLSKIYPTGKSLVDALKI